MKYFQKFSPECPFNIKTPNCITSAFLFPRSNNVTPEHLSVEQLVKWVMKSCEESELVNFNKRNRL